MGPRPGLRAAPKLVVVHKPKGMGTSKGTSQKPKDYGILGGALRSVGSAGKFIGGIAAGMPSFIGKGVQTAAGFGEGVFDFAADLASGIAGSDKEF